MERIKKGPLYKLKKFTVWCVRIPRCDMKQINVESGPCIICKQRLAHLGFGKIAFSNARGRIEIHKLDDYNIIYLTNNFRRLVKKEYHNDIKKLTSR